MASKEQEHFVSDENSRPTEKELPGGSYKYVYHTGSNIIV